MLSFPLSPAPVTVVGVAFALYEVDVVAEDYTNYINWGNLVGAVVFAIGSGITYIAFVDQAERYLPLDHIKAVGGPEPGEGSALLAAPKP